MNELIELIPTLGFPIVCCVAIGVCFYRILMMVLADSKERENNLMQLTRDISSKIDLSDLEIIHTRAEDLANDSKYREKYDIATTRAVSNFSTIKTSINIYMILNSYKSYIIANLSVLSTAVPAVTAGQSDGDLDGCGYRKIPANVVLFYPEKLSLYP